MKLACIMRKASLKYLQRSSVHTCIKAEDIAAFRSILPKQNIVLNAEALAPLNVDYLQRCHGFSTCMLKPSTTLQVSQILQYCNNHKIAVVTQGGRTGLVGGCTPVFDELIISMENFNRIISYDPVTSVLTCEAGCILENVENYAKKHQAVIPLDLGAKGSCFIGGNVATNAGGLHFVKYGSLRNNIKAITAVTADGAIHYLSSSHTTMDGDMKQLFIGSEGTLGVITDLSIQCYPYLPHKELCILAVNSYNDVCKILTSAKSYFQNELSAIEFFDSSCCRLVSKCITGVFKSLDSKTI